MTSSPPEWQKTLFIVLILILLPPLLLVILISSWLKTREEARLSRQFLKIHNNKTFLVCSRENGWYNFLTNNLLPFLNKEVIIVWLEDQRTNWLWRRIKFLLNASKHSPHRPFVFIIINRHIEQFVPLHELLLPLKNTGRKDITVQNNIREVLSKNFSELLKG